ncbi:DUF58 domain-containing protein [Saccharothrix sp. NPDC042600]|uniref:DUF58 domain-containing protein n=1 Tax=Saccharothrix TaxID=2071 RepID=UPI0033D5287E|nr:hypothetical protein GCM10017745_18380 [Saccharothrix mutabilis subsp. capreolus]
MRLTRRGVVVLVAAVGFFALGTLAGHAFFRALAGVAVGGLLAAVATTMVRPKVEVARTVHPERVERGTPALATLVVRNPTPRRLGGFTGGDRVGSSAHEVRVRPLAPGAEATYHHEVPTVSRGLLRVGPFQVHRFDPFDLVRGHPAVGGAASLWVHPRVHAARPPRVAHPRHHHDGPVTDPPLRGSADLRVVREYVPGDEVRLLHWKASARAGRLMVREHVDPARTRCTVVLDTRPTSMTAALFEEAVEVAASLVSAAASAGQPCGLVTCGAEFAVESGLRAARALLDRLCVVVQDAPAGAALVRAAAVRPGGAVVVVTGGDADLGPVARWRPDAVIRLGAPRGATAGVIGAGSAVEAVASWNALVGS